MRPCATLGRGGALPQLVLWEDGRRGGPWGRAVPVAVPWGEAIAPLLARPRGPPPPCPVPPLSRVPLEGQPQPAWAALGLQGVPQLIAWQDAGAPRGRGLRAGGPPGGAWPGHAKTTGPP